jgi:hypothetical protein
MSKKLFILVILLLGSIPAFSQTVDTAWVRRYKEGNHDDIASAITVDGFGGVYVTGWSTGSGTSLDYATVKYDSSGNEVWVQRYDGTGDWSSADLAYDIAVDSLGNAYVTGVSDGSGTYHDYVTIKYDPEGNIAPGWPQRYNGPANGWDAAYAIAVDRLGNVYVAGESDGSGTGYDYATIKYDSTGDTAWVRRYNGPPGNSDDEAYALAVDGSGNVYVTGYSYGSGTGVDYATIKYDSYGDTAWVRRYNGPGNSGDYGLAIAVDGSGNVYITGYSYGSGTGSDYATIKYDSNGDTAWVRRYNELGNGYDEARAIAVDSAGNVYVTGLSVGNGTGEDYVTIKYYPNGDTAWVRRYNGPGNSADYGSDITLDGFGNVYVTGVTGWSLTSGDYTTVKYDTNGNEHWVKIYDGPGAQRDEPTAMTIDKSCNVYVTGSSYDSLTKFDYVTIKYVQGDTNYVKDETGNREKPSEFTLSQNYPNPFNQSTKIEFTLSQSCFVSLHIYDPMGRKIRTLVSENLSPGYKSVLWDGKDNSGKVVASGIYFYRLKIGDYSEAKRLVLLK